MKNIYNKKMIRIFSFCFLWSFLFVLYATGQEYIMISEVYYDAINEAGSEAVELYNPNDYDIDISDYIISTDSSSKDATLPEGSTIKAHSYFLIADSGFSTSKDNLAWPNANYEETINLYNTDAGIALIFNNETIDAVGWGNADEIKEGHFEGNPTDLTIEGQSISRIFEDNYFIDTDNNFADFEIGVPNLLGSTDTGSNNNISDNSTPNNSTRMRVIVTITGAAPSIKAINLLNDESTEPGIQYFPEPGVLKYVQVEAEVSDQNGVKDIKLVKGNLGDIEFPLNNYQNLSSTDATYIGNIPLEYYFKAGNYSVNITVIDHSNLTYSSSADFNFLALAAIEIDTKSISFSTQAGYSEQIIGDIEMETADKPTIKNIGNIQIDIGISGTDLKNNENTLSSTILTYSFLDNIFTGSLSGILNKNPTRIDVNIPNRENSCRELSLKLDAPLNSLPGTYEGSIYVYGITS